ncbi:MAG: LysM peptidoglycan-binding domain-containing protein [Candidatus Melainabacteria bacterium]|nr:LysM peptidoglycan-binding domain-containing protein [Candidatus Melainabacteria bacterium]
MATGFDAKTDATDIGNAAKSKGVEAASTVFQAELDEINKADPAAGDKTELNQALTKELEQRGILPEMAADWAKNNFSKLDKDGNGGVSFDEITFATQFSKQGSAERAYLESLGNNYQRLVNQVQYDVTATGRGGTQREINGISGKDIDAFMAGKSDGRANMDIAAMLTDNKDFLFDALDVARTGLDDKDGKVSRSDIETYVKQLDTNKDGKIGDDELNNEKLLGGVDKEDRRKVADALSFLKEQKNWDSEQVKRLRDGGVITMDSMAKGLGFKNGKDADVSGMKAAVAAQTGDDPALDKVEAPAPGTTLNTWEKAAIEGFLTKHPEVTAQVADNGVVSKEKLDNFLATLKDNPEEAMKYDPSALVSLNLLQNGFNSVSKDGGKTVALENISESVFTGSDAGPGVNAPETVETPETFTVRPGDSVWKIAQEKLGPQASNQQIADLMNAILAANKMSPESYIYAGDKLIIPKG